MGTTKIEWADKTWNPVTGCSPVSEGCQHCYAKRMARRLRGRCYYDYNYPFKVKFWPDRLDQISHWRKPCRIFVCSMGDIFHPDVHDQWRLDIWHIMEHSPQHTFMVLTKRPLQARSFLLYREPMKHIWLGVTAENQKCADERIPILLSIPAAVHFVSVEPMLGPVDLHGLGFWYRKDIVHYDGNGNGMKQLDWVIAGPETGPGARPAVDGVKNYIDDLYWQCKEAGVPFFDKRKEHWIEREWPK